MLFRNRRSPERRRTRSPRSWRTRVAGLAAAALALSLVQANVGFAAADRGAAEVAPRAAADVVRVAEFLAECPYTHRAPDDPIIFPGLPGASHMHSFFGNVDPSQDFANCPAGTVLESYLDFPQCWNGTDLDSADKSHMAYPVAGECPSTHPVPVPKLRQVLRYPVNGDPARFRLASGPGFTMHGDFFNVWPEEELAQRVRDCINAIVKCGFDGRP
ncbi:DUF1996 domain-containing protein [Streptomyces bacillaris]|uniref:DUF1996 domain-containing protein n=1 Tax=Streptomyces bacillaris TaxID=68179 RepID=UPI003699D181